MDEINGLTQPIPSASKEIVIQIQRHERVQRSKVISCDESSLFIECQWRVILGSREVDDGISAKGVKSIEPVYWLIPFDFPERPISPFLRKDFPRSKFPHIYPSKFDDFVRPCITETGITSYLLANGISRLLLQLDSWLDRAALDSLMLEEQGWEPTIC